MTHDPLCPDSDPNGWVSLDRNAWISIPTGSVKDALVAISALKEKP